MTSVIQYYGTGRRKSASARVRLIPGTGQVAINGRTLDDYVGGRPGLKKNFESPIAAADAAGRFDMIVTVRGGGIVGQVGAIRHGIARALAEAAPQNRPALRVEGLLTRDPRVKERKKYGRKKARKRFQFSKR
ncbi:MAG: 30S ribosomal protein S9 [Candidatus Melainabacteria bacterium]|jgi:small subunit ribosomal protein S9|nr:MAG: 30S ribosomal protein S9 [Candidatus Melainabacteria bacterium]